MEADFHIVRLAWECTKLNAQQFFGILPWLIGYSSN